MEKEIDKQFVPYDLAIKLKYKGFDKPCLGYHNIAYGDESLGFSRGSGHINTSDKKFPSAPMYQQVIDWFDDNNKIRIDLTHATSNGAYKYTIWKWNYDNNVGQWEKVLYLNSFNDKIERNNKAISEALNLI